MRISGRSDAIDCDDARVPLPTPDGSFESPNVACADLPFPYCPINPAIRRLAVLVGRRTVFGRAFVGFESQEAIEVRWTLMLSLLLGTISAGLTYRFGWVDRRDTPAPRPQVADLWRPSPSDRLTPDSPITSPLPSDSILFPRIAAAEAAERSTAAESLDGLPMAGMWSSGIGAGLAPHLRLASLAPEQRRNAIRSLRDELLDDPLLEIFLPPRDRLIATIEEARELFGDDDDFVRRWEIHRLRVDFEHGLIDRTAAQRLWLERVEPLAATRPEWRDYLAIRRAQWFPPDAPTALPEFDAGWYGRTSRRPTDEGWILGLAAADVVRFLDRTGHLETARETLERWRVYARRIGVPRLKTPWLLAEAAIAAHDLDFGAAAGHAETARRVAETDDQADRLLLDWIRGHHRMYDSAVETPRESILRPVVATTDDRWRAAEHPFWPDRVAFVARADGSHRVALLDRLMTRDRQVEPAAAILAARLVFASPELRRFQRADGDGLALMALAERLPVDDVARIDGLLMAAQLTGEQRVGSAEQIETLIANLEPAIRRLERLAARETMSRADRYRQAIPTGIGFLAARLPATPELDRRFAAWNLRLRDLPARRLKSAIAAARTSPEGRRQLTDAFSAAADLSRAFWSETNAWGADRHRRVSTALREAERCERELIRSAPGSVQEVTPSEFAARLPADIAVIDLVQQLPYESDGQEDAELVGYLHARFGPDDPRASVRRVRLGIVVVANPSGIVSYFAAPHADEPNESGPVNGPVRSLRAVSKRQLAKEALERIERQLPDHVTTLLLVPDGRTVDFPWASAFRESAVDAERARRLHLGFHPYQAIETPASDCRSFLALAGGEFDSLRSDPTSTLRSLGDLPGVAMELTALRESVATRVDDGEPIFGPWGPHVRGGEANLLHVAGHARSVDLLRLGYGPEPIDRDEMRWRQELGSWRRMPFVASALVLGDEVLQSSPGWEGSPFLSAAMVICWPEAMPETVVLATCDPLGGRSIPTSTPDSIAKAFWIAGAKRILASPDRVADDEPARLLPSLYRQHLEGASFAEAYRAAYRESHADRRREQPSHPGHDWCLFGF